jgi:hypothetical protein
LLTHPPTVMGFGRLPTYRTRIRCRRGVSASSIALVLGRPRLILSQQRCRRCRFAGCLWSRRSWFQDCVHHQAFPDKKPHCRGSGASTNLYSRTSQKLTVS